MPKKLQITYNTIPYRAVSGLLDSIVGVAVLLALSVYITSLLFGVMNGYLAGGSSWENTSWGKSLDDENMSKLLCQSLKKTILHWNGKCAPKEQAAELDKLRLHIAKTPADVRKHLIKSKKGLRINLPKEIKEEAQHEASRRMYFLLSSQSVQKTKKDEPYLEAYALMEIAVQNQPRMKSLVAHLWIGAQNGAQIIWLKRSSALLLEQSKWFIGLWPTKSLVEPKMIGSWMTHNFNQRLKDKFYAEYLLPETKLLKKVATFVSTWTENRFSAAKSSTFAEQSFWLTFMNGSNRWGLIQWLSFLVGVFVILQLFLRYVLVEFVQDDMLRYRQFHPIDFREALKPNITTSVNFEMSRSGFPHLQAVLLSKLAGQDAVELEESQMAKFEKSRAITEYLISSLPSIGFIGTIIGIAFAIEKAHLVVTQDEFIRLQAIKSLSTELALAFSTTFVSLIFTLFCEFFSKKQWKKEDLFSEEMNSLRATWAWLDRSEPSEQAQNSFLAK